jgi:hypothetical protein
MLAVQSKDFEEFAVSAFPPAILALADGTVFYGKASGR